MSKSAKNDLVSIYKLEFYKRKKKWIIPTRASKGSKKDRKQLEKKISEGKVSEDSKNSRDPDLVTEEQEIRDLNKTYSVETINNKSTWNEAFIESGNGLDAGIDNEDADSTESPQLMIEKTEPVVNYKVFWPQLMLTGITNNTEVDSNYCFNPYDYQDGDYIKGIKKNKEYQLDFNANIEKAQDIDNNPRHYDNGDHEFVNSNDENVKQENDFDQELDNIFVKRNSDPQTINDNNCLYQYGNVVTNEGMYYEIGYDNANGYSDKEEPKIATDENYLQNVLMQINNEVTTAEGRVLDELGSCSSLNTLRFMEGARHAPHSSEIDLYDINKEQMCLSDRNAMEKYNEIIHEEQLMSQKLNNRKRQNADSYLWNKINNGVMQEMSKVHRPPTVTTINDSNINVEATNQLSKLLLGDKTDNNEPKHDNHDVTIVTNKKDSSFNGNKTLVYKKFPKIPIANQSMNECYENLKNYPMLSGIFDENHTAYASRTDEEYKSGIIQNDDDTLGYEDEDLSSKNIFMYLNNTKNSSYFNATSDFNKCLPKLNSAPSSVSGRSQDSNKYPKYSNNYPQNNNNYQQNSNNYPQNSNNYPQSFNNHLQNSNNYQQNSNNYPQNSNNYPQNSNNYPQSFNNHLQNSNNYPQNSNNYPQSFNNHLQNSNNYPKNSNYTQNSNNYAQNSNNCPQNFNKTPRNLNNNSPKFETDVAPYYINNQINHGSRANSVYSDNIRIQYQKATNNSKIPIPSLNIPSPNLNTTAPILNSPSPNLNPLPNLNIPPPNFRRCLHENNDPVIKKKSASYVDLQGVNFCWSMNTGPVNYLESLHHHMVGGRPNAPCFLNIAPKGRGRGRLMKS